MSMMYNFPIIYDEPLFRPPSEGKSLIIQATLGCSYNDCSFCEMYTSKKFKARPEEEVFKDIESFEPYNEHIRKVFIADGDPMVLSTKRLLRILNKISSTFPNLRRVSTYASPTNLNRKSDQELKELKEAGLTLLYVGIESGDDAVLNLIRKGETFDSVVSGLNKSKKAGMEASVMIINGVGGAALSKQHAKQSALVLNETQPKFASTLVLTAHKGLDHYKSRLNGEFTELTKSELFHEMRRFLEHINLNETIFRSDHASNHLVLKGVLNKDKDYFLSQIDQVLSDPNSDLLRPDHFRGY